MDLLPMDRLGPRETSRGRVEFGIFLPWISAEDGNSVSVKIIHERDQFLKDIPCRAFPLACSLDPIYGEYWSGSVAIGKAGAKKGASSWGKPGRYVYRYELESPLLDRPLDWIIDPYAREFGVGRQSAFTLGDRDFRWGKAESSWKTPELADLVVYEIMLHEFASDLEGAREKLPYLADLGVNCLEIMPIANVDRSIDWGFEPVGPFGLDERFGRPRDFQDFVQAAHGHGIAVVLDMIYGHTGLNFAYEYAYSRLGYRENPFMGPFAKDMFGPSADFARRLTRDFYLTANLFWIERYHLDGIRYDCVPNYYDGCQGQGYANLVYNTWQAIKKKKGDADWRRFFTGDGFNLIQCAEQLECPVEIVEKTYCNCTWQNETLNAAERVASGDYGGLYDLGMSLGLSGYPDVATHGTDSMAKSAFQYLENHDHPRFICNFGTDSLYRDVFREGKRENWYREQPFIIALLLARGIPLIWQGEEIVENYDVPDSGPARIGTLRPVRWERFYTEEGKPIVALFRALLTLRNENAVFRKGGYYFVNDWERFQRKGLLLFERRLGASFALVAVNFSDAEAEADYAIAETGDYAEKLHPAFGLGHRSKGETARLCVPPNYGRVWMT